MHKFISNIIRKYSDSQKCGKLTGDKSLENNFEDITKNSLQIVFGMSLEAGKWDVCPSMSNLSYSKVAVPHSYFWSYGRDR